MQICHDSTPSSSTPSTSSSSSSSSTPAAPGMLQRLGRVLQEKAAGDFERFFKGTSKTRERLGLVEELLTFWSLEDYENTLEELEEALITADFGPKTALKVRGGAHGGPLTSQQTPGPLILPPPPGPPALATLRNPANLALAAVVQIPIPRPQGPEPRGMEAPSFNLLTHP